MSLIERDDPERRWFIAVDKLTGKTLDVADRRSDAISGVEHVEVAFASQLRGAVGALHAMTPENPWHDDGSQDCRWCGAHYEHDPDCPWVAARTLLAGQ